MAFRPTVTNYWKSMKKRLGSSKSTAHADQHDSMLPKKAEFVPVYASIGLVALAAGLGVFTMYQHLHNSPDVHVKKKTRETLIELEDPDKVMDESSRHMNKSLFRKIAHVQEFDHAMPALPEEIHRDAFAYQPHAETLKDLGIDPKTVHGQ